MIIDDSALQNVERAIFSLRDLYRRYGYSQYKMSKFEEYDLYVRNKDYLISDNIITFTDTNGKLMALKPDVTLSIIKNTQDRTDSVKKLYYNENVYRVSKGTHTFKEIMQTGLECIGSIDEYCIYEVLMLAAQSLVTISSDCVLDISHLGIVSGVIDGLGLGGEDRASVIRCVGEKNFHEISAILERNSIPTEKAEVLKTLVTTYGTPDEVEKVISSLPAGSVDEEALSSLLSVTKCLADGGFGNIVRIDFSVINDMNYYNGIVFRGFVNGIPTGILSGGQYDNLMRKMGHKSSAIGFAVYLDMLERFGETETEYDVDIMIIYKDGADMNNLSHFVRDLVEKTGKSVTAQKAIPEKLRCKELLYYEERGE